MKTLLILLSLTTYLMKPAAQAAGPCRPSSHCASGTECYDAQIGEMVCKVADPDPKKKFRSVLSCTNRAHMPTTLVLQQALEPEDFDRVVVERHGFTSEYFIAVGFPALHSEVIAADLRGALKLEPLVNDVTKLTIGDRNLGKTSTYRMMCERVPFRIGGGS